MLGAASLKSEPARRGRRPGETPETKRLAVLERELQDVRKTLLELRGALDPLTAAQRDLAVALDRAQEVRAEGRARAENVRAEAMSRAHDIVARGEARAQEVVSRGNLDADRVEARAEAYAEEIIAEAQERLQAAASQAELRGVHVPRPPSSPLDLADQPVVGPGPGETTDWAPLAPAEEAWTDRPVFDEGPLAGELAVAPGVDGAQRIVVAGPSDASGADQTHPNQALDEGLAAAMAVEDESALQLSVSTISGEELRCRLDGSLSFAGMLALEKSLAALSGVRSARVSPQDQGAMVTIVSSQPHQALHALVNLSEFSIRTTQR